jgi:hypothetical protein
MKYICQYICICIVADNDNQTMCMKVFNATLWLVMTININEKPKWPITMANGVILMLNKRYVAIIPAALG